MIEIYQDHGKAEVLYIVISDTEYYKYRSSVRGWELGENRYGVDCLRHSQAKRITAEQAAKILGYIPKETES